MSTKPLTTEEKNLLTKTINKQALRDYEKQESFYTVTEMAGGMMEKPAVKTSKTLAYGKEYSDQLNKFIQKTLDDELYDERQKAVLIERKAEELQAEYLEKIEQTVEEYNTSNAEIEEYLQAELFAHDRLTPAEQKEIEFTERELTGQVKTALMMANNTGRINEIYSDLLKKAQVDKYTARFLVNNAYLFLERLQQLGGNPAEFAGTIERAKRLMYTEKQLLLDKVLQNVKGMKRLGVDGKRIIEANRKRALELAEKLKREHTLNERMNYDRRQNNY